MKFSDDKLKKVTEKIIEEFDPEKIILFGSRATGQETTESDVDLLIVKDTNQSTRNVARKIDRVLFPRLFPLDLIIYTPKQFEFAKESGDFFIQEVLKNGKVLYAK